MWRQDWVVHSQAVGDGRASLKYLAPYVFRVAISDRRIVSCDDGQVTFSYRQSGSNRWRKMTVDRLGVHPPLPATRFAQRLPEGAALRLPEPQQPGLARAGALADRVVSRFGLRAAGPPAATGAGRAANPLRRLRRADDRRRFRASHRTLPFDTS